MDKGWQEDYTTARLEELKRSWHKQLNADIFSDGARQERALAKLHPRPSRLLRYYRRITLYLSVLWRALKGDTFEREDDDYYD